MVVQSCAQCGMALQPYSYFCASCGAPATGNGPNTTAGIPQISPAQVVPPVVVQQPSRPAEWSSGSKAMVAVALSVAVVAITAVVVIAVRGNVFSWGSGTALPGDQVVVQTATPLPYGNPGYQSPSTTTVPNSGGTVQDDETAAYTKLQQQASQDRSQVESLVGYWLPQVSSKKPGLVAHGVTYDYRMIWSDFVSTRSQYPGALLLWSGNFSGFRSKDFWVTVVPNAYSSGQTANSWCDSMGIGKDDCYAKRLTHTGTAEANTLQR
jgi:hypothetical protein